MFRLDYLSCFTVVATTLAGRKIWTGLVVSGVNNTPSHRNKRRSTGSTAHQDVIGLKHALQLGVGITIIVLTVVLAWQ
jgi:hypothetical protein